MMALSLEQKSAGAELRARELTAEKHFFDENQPFYPLGFDVVHRNPGHWDIYAKRCPGYEDAFNHAHPNAVTLPRGSGQERAFCIRGEPGDVSVRDERWNPYRPHPRPAMTFRSVMAAMLWIIDELMREPEE